VSALKSFSELAVLKRTPDAIQLATAFKSGATLAITNDEGWQHIAGMETLLLADLIDQR
jgi:hypothetical protein